MNQIIKERPILFKGKMVCANLNGNKTQTRRIVKPQCAFTSGSGFSWKGFLYGAAFNYSETVRNFAFKACPYGKPGDRLWVRETWSVLADRHYAYVHYAATEEITKHIDRRRLTAEQDWQLAHWNKKDGWAPSIHMPRWASRILLEVVDVRVERLNDISEQDAKAEGILQHSGGSYLDYQDEGESYVYGPRDSFASLWSSINGRTSWNDNPWVWCVTYKRIENNNTEN